MLSANDHHVDITMCLNLTRFNKEIGIGSGHNTTTLFLPVTSWYPLQNQVQLFSGLEINQQNLKHLLKMQGEANSCHWVIASSNTQPKLERIFLCTRVKHTSCKCNYKSRVKYGLSGNACVVPAPRVPTGQNYPMQPQRDICLMLFFFPEEDDSVVQWTTLTFDLRRCFLSCCRKYMQDKMSNLVWSETGAILFLISCT